jgi:hypothetical protein
MAEKYQAREPDLVWTLADLGLLDRGTAERNQNRWMYEMEHLDSLWVQAETAWKELSWWNRVRIGFTRGSFGWKLDWRRANDPWRAA